MTRLAAVLANPITCEAFITNRDELRPLNLTELRKRWRDNDRAIVQAFRRTDFQTIGECTDYKWLVLMPEFDRRGYTCSDPITGMVLNQPRKSQESHR